MLIGSVLTRLWDENCYVIAAQPGGGAVIVDPGLGLAAALTPLLESWQATPVAVLASHGHLDHVADAAEVCDRYDIPLYIHPADRVLLSDPMAGLGMGDSVQLAQLTGRSSYSEPRTVVEISDGQVFELAGLGFTVCHAPGHRPGCVIYHLPAEAVALTGDVIFAGSIGRTDLPGGSPAAMRQTLRQLAWGGEDGRSPLGLPDDTTLLPGHGETTTMAQERADNPYLQASFLGRP